MQSLQQINDEVSCAGAGIENIDGGITEGQAEDFGQHVRDALAHEVDNRLRRINNAVRVRHLDRITLKESLVYYVQEMLLFGESLDALSRRFDCNVKAIKRT